jgi:hypothetical protein
MAQSVFIRGARLMFLAMALAGAGAIAIGSPAQVPDRQPDVGCIDAPSKRLERVTSVQIAPIERFVARDHFAIGGSNVVIKSTAEIFVRYFDIVEERVPAADLTVYRLREPTLDTSIIAGLHDRHETHLSQLWTLLERQGQGEPGPLLTDDESNIFYIRDGQGMLWTVSVSWANGWDIDVGSIGAAYPWRSGRQVIGRSPQASSAGLCTDPGC